MESLGFHESKQLLHYLFDLRNRRTVAGCLKDGPVDGYVAFLDGSVGLLNDDFQRIIRNDFEHPTAPNWWQSYYSRTTYYRLKNSAMKELLSVLKR